MNSIFQRKMLVHGIATNAMGKELDRKDVDNMTAWAFRGSRCCNSVSLDLLFQLKINLIVNFLITVIKQLCKTA
jgi:hypothetical protein